MKFHLTTALALGLAAASSPALAQETTDGFIRDTHFDGPGAAPPDNPFLIPSGGTNLALSNKNFEFHSLRATVSYQF